MSHYKLAGSCDELLYPAGQGAFPPPRPPRYNAGCDAVVRPRRTGPDHFAQRTGGPTSACLEGPAARTNRR